MTTDCIANPLDRAMYTFGSDTHPCHLLITFKQPLVESRLLESISTNDTLQTLSGMTFYPGGNNRPSVWRRGASSQIEAFSTSVPKDFLRDFNPETFLPPLKNNFRFVTLQHHGLCSALLLSWSHTFTDARGGEILLQLACGENLPFSFASPTDNPSPSSIADARVFGDYCAERRGYPAPIPSPAPKRFFLECPQDILWPDNQRIFFKSAWLLSALLIAQTTQSPLICAIPVSTGRDRVFPGNQLKIIHLSITPQDDFLSLYSTIIEEMARVVREGLPEKSRTLLYAANHLDEASFAKVLQYPAINQFADLCVSSLGKVYIPSLLLGTPVQEVRHYPPLFSWGGKTLVHYDYGRTSTLCLLADSDTLLEDITQTINAPSNLSVQDGNTLT